MRSEPRRCGMCVADRDGITVRTKASATLEDVAQSPSDTVALRPEVRSLAALFAAQLVRELLAEEATDKHQEATAKSGNDTCDSEDAEA